MTLLREGFQLLAHFAQHGGLSRLGLLQAILVTREVLFERLQQRGDGLLSLCEISFGGFSKLGQRFVRESEKFWLHLAQGVGAQRFEGLTEIKRGARLFLSKLNE